MSRRAGANRSEPRCSMSALRSARRRRRRQRARRRRPRGLGGRLAQALPRPGAGRRPARLDRRGRAVVRLCAAHGTSIVTQGGNTGLVGGSVPDASGTPGACSAWRGSNRVRGVDAANLTMTVEAGCVLQRVQEAAADAGLLFAAQPRRRGQLHDRRQPRHQRRRHPGAALRQRARAVPRPRGRDRRPARSGTACRACARTTPATTCAT